MTQTSDVLRAIGSDGVVVGSVAAGKASPKDIDLVIRPRREDRVMGSRSRNPIFERLLTQFECESECVGHLWIDADPLPVELFEYAGWGLQGDKGKGCVSFRQASKGAVEREVFGVTVKVKVGE